MPTTTVGRENNCSESTSVISGGQTAYQGFEAKPLITLSLKLRGGLEEMLPNRRFILVNQIFIQRTVHQFQYMIVQCLP